MKVPEKLMRLIMMTVRRTQMKVFFLQLKEFNGCIDVKESVRQRDAFLATLFNLLLNEVVELGKYIN